MRSAENIENFIKSVRLKASNQMHDRNLNDALEAQEKSRRAKSVQLEPSIWRMIMKKKIVKFAAAAVFIIAVVIGTYAVGGPRVALARTTEVMKIKLSALKEIIIKLRTRDRAQEPTQPARPAPIKSIETVKSSNSFQYDLFLVQGEQENLLSFFQKQDIEFTPTTNNANVSYSILDCDEADSFIAFSQSSNELKLLVPPRLQIIAGESGIIGNEDLALAVAGTLAGDNEHIDLSFSFHDGKTGIEVPSVRIKTDEAVLIRILKTATATGNNGSKEENDIFILIRTKLLPPTQ